jgi:hypothetical protein
LSQITDRLIARYGTLSSLASGGMGTLYRVHDPARGEDVAIKTVSKADPALLERLRREASVLQRLSHPNLCPIYEWHEDVDADSAWIVMPLLDGLSLDRCARDLAVPELVELMIQVCQGVEAAHAMGLVHRDLKPSNIMLLNESPANDSQPRRRAVVLDFGIAHVDDATTLTGTHEVLGTPAYMAPEQARGDTALVDQRCDVWGLGATLYDVLTGQPPFGRGSLAQVMARVLDDDVQSPRVHRPSLPEDLARICLKALERDPARRYQDVATLRQDLQRHLDGARVDAPSAGPGYYLRRMLSRHPRFWAGMAALAVALLIAVGVAIHATLSASQRAVAARELATMVERVRAGMLAARLAPVHPIDDERAPLLADIASLQQRYDQRRGPLRRELDRALALAAFDLGQLDQARLHALGLLQADSDALERDDRLLYARIELALYARHWPTVADLPGSQREAALQTLREAHLQPALAATATLERLPPLLQARLQLTEGRIDAARQALSLLPTSERSQSEALLVRGDIDAVAARQARSEGRRDDATSHYEHAQLAYREHTRIYRSDPAGLARACDMAAQLQALRAAEGRVQADTVAALDRSCADLTQVDPNAASTRQALARAWLALARAHDEANQPAEARRLLAHAINAADEAVHADPDRNESRLLLARALKLDAGLVPDDYPQAHERFDRAVTQLTIARERAPASVPVLIALGETLRDRGRLRQNYHALQPAGQARPGATDYEAAGVALQQALALQPATIAIHQALALTLMFDFYDQRGSDPAQALTTAKAAIDTLDLALARQPDHPDLLFDQAANLGDLWSFQASLAERSDRRATLPTLERAFELFARLRRLAPQRADGYDYEIGFRAQAGERLREVGLERSDMLAPLPALVAAAEAAGVRLSEQFLGWALTEHALALADARDPAAAVAFERALVVLERGLADPHRRYDSIRMLLQWSGAQAELLPAHDPTRAASLARAEALFEQAISGDRGRGDNILWCEGGRIAWELRRNSDPAAARTEALRRFDRCRELSPRHFEPWQERYRRIERLGPETSQFDASGAS